MVYAVPMTAIRLADRIDQGAWKLPPPRPVPGTGGMIYTMALAVPGVYDYPFGSVLTPWSTLRDPEHMSALVGVPVIDDDRTAHAEGVDTSTIERESIGRIIRVWPDEANQVLMAEAVIDVDRGLAKIADGVTGVSEGYDVLLRDEVGEAYGRRYVKVQAKREAPSNVAITRNPRHRVTRVGDSEAGMKEIEELMKARLADGFDPMAMFQMLMEMLMGARGEADGYKRELADMKAAGGKPAADEGEGGPPGGEEGEAPPPPEPETMADAATLIRAADAAGVVIEPEDTRATLSRKLLIARGVPKRTADSLEGDALAATLAALATVPTRTADAWETVRDTTTNNKPAVDVGAWSA